MEIKQLQPLANIEFGWKSIFDTFLAFLKTDEVFGSAFAVSQNLGNVTSSKSELNICRKNYTDINTYQNEWIVVESSSSEVKIRGGFGIDSAGHQDRTLYLDSSTYQSTVAYLVTDTKSDTRALIYDSFGLRMCHVTGYKMDDMSVAKDAMFCVSYYGDGYSTNSTGLMLATTGEDPEYNFNYRKVHGNISHYDYYRGYNIGKCTTSMVYPLTANGYIYPDIVYVDGGLTVPTAQTCKIGSNTYFRIYANMFMKVI